MKTMKPQEIKHGDIHCFTSCGFNCKAAVLEQVTDHYNLLLLEVGDGWKVRTWHNCGWNAELVHELSGLFLNDQTIRTNPQQVIQGEVKPGYRYYCYNYSDDKTSQIRAYGATPKEAIESAIDQAIKRSDAYVELVNKLRGSKKDSIVERCPAGAIAALGLLAKGHGVTKANDAFELYAGHRLAFSDRLDMIRILEFYAKGGK